MTCCGVSPRACKHTQAVNASLPTLCTFSASAERLLIIAVPELGFCRPCENPLVSSTVTARAKLRDPVLHSVSTTFYLHGGLVLTLKSKCVLIGVCLRLARSRLWCWLRLWHDCCRPSDWLKLKAVLHQQQNAAVASVVYVPQDGKRMEITADFTMHNLKSVANVVLGVKWTF